MSGSNKETSAPAQAPAPVTAAPPSPSVNTSAPAPIPAPSPSSSSSGSQMPALSGAFAQYSASQEFADLNKIVDYLNSIKNEYKYLAKVEPKPSDKNYTVVVKPITDLLSEASSMRPFSPVSQSARGRRRGASFAPSPSVAASLVAPSPSMAAVRSASAFSPTLQQELQAASPTRFVLPTGATAQYQEALYHASNGEGGSEEQTSGGERTNGTGDVAQHNTNTGGHSNVSRPKPPGRHNTRKRYRKGTNNYRLRRSRRNRR